MPLALTQNEVTESGHDYDDELGVSYEFPRRYLSAESIALALEGQADEGREEVVQLGTG